MKYLLPDFSSSGSSQQQSSLSYDVRVIRGKGDANGDILPSKNASANLFAKILKNKLFTRQRKRRYPSKNAYVKLIFMIIMKSKLFLR